MSVFVFQLQAPRPSFALDATDAELAVMADHAAHWQPYIDDGRMVFFGPVLDDQHTSYGLAVLDVADQHDQTIRDHAAHDPAVTTGTAHLRLGTMLKGYVRSAPADAGAHD